MPDGTPSAPAPPSSWVGTPRYMAPEQIRCQEVDERADIYSLGAILFHLLSGRPPFSGTTVFEVFTQHLRDPVPSIAAITGVDDVPPELERIVRRCLAKSPGDRYASMQDVVADLEAVLRQAGELVPFAPLYRAFENKPASVRKSNAVR